MTENYEKGRQGSRDGSFWENLPQWKDNVAENYEKGRRGSRDGCFWANHTATPKERETFTRNVELLYTKLTAYLKESETISDESAPHQRLAFLATGRRDQQQAEAFWRKAIDERDRDLLDDHNYLHSFAIAAAHRNIPESVLASLRKVIDYLFEDEERDLTERSGECPDHIFHDVENLHGYLALFHKHTVS